VNQAENLTVGITNHQVNKFHYGNAEMPTPSRNKVGQTIPNVNSTASQIKLSLGPHLDYKLYCGCYNNSCAL